MAAVSMRRQRVPTKDEKAEVSRWEHRKAPISCSRLCIAVLAALSVCLTSVFARAADVVPAVAELPPLLSLDDALRIFHKRGLDLLIADASTRSAEGDVKIAGAIANPEVSASIGNDFTYTHSNFGKRDCLQGGAKCSPWIYNVGITDSAAIGDALTGKRNLRLKAARNALAAAKMARVDAERTIAFQVKAAYVQVAQATLALRFAKDIAATQATELQRTEDRFKGGAIHEGDLQRIAVQKLAADQAVDSATFSLRSARVALAFLLGVRGNIPDFDVDTKVLDYSVPSSLRDATEVGLLRTAFQHRPDLAGLGYLRQQAEAQIALVKRQRIPDITLGVNYAWGGGYGGLSANGPLQSQEITFGISAPLPVFYGLEGEMRQARAQYDTSKLEQAKVTSQVVSDVATGIAAFSSAKSAVERMEGPRRAGGGLLQSARGAFEITAIQYEKGAASVTDYLDALRTYISTKNDYLDALANYWTAVFELEASVARDLR
jgi:cobalt-zinc-cadmium efflux system outer membrane protein